MNFVSFVVKGLVWSDHFPDGFVLADKIITALTHGQGGGMHLQTDLLIRAAFPNFLER